MKTLRLHQIKEYVYEHGAASYAELCSRFGVSLNTIRRDAAELESQGTVRKVYGGLRARRQSEVMFSSKKYAINTDQKNAIARKAAEFIEDGDTIYIDPGTTVPYILDYVGSKRITVVTASLNAVIKAAEMENVNLYVLSGTLNRETYVFEDFDAYNLLERFAVTKAFFSALGFDLVGGAMISSQWEFEMKSHALKNNTESFLLIDNTKFHRTAMMKYAEANEIRNIITCGPVDEEYLDYFEKNDINLYLVPED